MSALVPPTPDGWQVRPISAARAGKDYTCPDCGNRIARGNGHVVTWPDGLPDLRRHWHRHCWRVAVRSGRMW